MTSKTHLALVPARSTGGSAQPSDSKRHFASRPPVIECVADRIRYRFAQGTSERALSVEFETKREFIEEVVRRGYQQLRTENARLRMERAA